MAPKTVANLMSGPNGPRLKQMRTNNPNAAKRAIKNIMNNPNKSVNNVIRNAKAAVQANNNAKQAATQAVNAKNNTAANNAARQANTAANNAATAANAARQAQRQVQNNPNVPVNSKNVAKNAAVVANNNARQANVVANIAATAVAPPPPPPPPPAKPNQNGEPKGTGAYMDEAKKLWKDIDRMIKRAEQTNFKPANNNTNNVTVSAKVIESLRKNISKLSKDVLAVSERFKKEVNSLLKDYPELQDTYKHLANCETNTNNKSGGCPRVRNMDKYIGEIKAAIDRKKNANMLIKQAKNVNERQRLQEEENKKAKNQEVLVAKRKALRVNVNGLVQNLKNLQNKI